VRIIRVLRIKQEQGGCWRVSFDVQRAGGWAIPHAAIVALWFDVHTGADSAAVLQHTCQINASDREMLVDICRKFSAYADSEKRELMLDQLNERLRGDT